MNALSTQVGGTHYKGVAIQHFTFCQRNRMSWGPASILKYVLRYDKKNGYEDLKKALHYLILTVEDAIPMVPIDYGLGTPPQADYAISLRFLRQYSVTAEEVRPGGILPGLFIQENGYQPLERIIRLICTMDQMIIEHRAGGVCVLGGDIHHGIHLLMEQHYPMEYASDYGDQVKRGVPAPLAV